jgi:hypothetical protein
MKTLKIPGAGTIALAAMGVLTLGAARAPGRTEDPAQVVPLAEIAAPSRDAVAEVIRENTFHHRGEPETFPCHSRIYLSLLNEPALTLALWKDLSASPVRLQQVGPNVYHGTDGNGASGSWEFVYRSPKLHVLLCNLQYQSPRGNTHLEGRIVLVVHSGFYREVNGDPWVSHDVDAYVKIDSKGWKLVAKTFRPLLEKLLEEQVREAGWFVSLMGRLVAMYPNWACQVTLNQPEINQDVRARFRDVVIQTRRPGAFTGRPTLAENARGEPPAPRR